MRCRYVVGTSIALVQSAKALLLDIKTLHYDTNILLACGPDFLAPRTPGPSQQAIVQPKQIYPFDQSNMDPESATCRIRVKWPRDDISGPHAIQRLRDVPGFPAVTDSLRQRWTEEIVKSFSSSPNLDKSIRSWDMLLHQDGSVDAVLSEKGGRSFYPSRFRIPPHSILGLDEEEKVKRAERFALGSLLYEVMTAKEPYEELSDDMVQENYSCGIFPDDVFSMAMGPYILGCWSLEFEKETERLSEQSV